MGNDDNDDQDNDDETHPLCIKASTSYSILNYKDKQEKTQKKPATNNSNLYGDLDDDINYNHNDAASTSFQNTNLINKNKTKSSAAAATTTSHFDVDDVYDDEDYQKQEQNEQKSKKRFWKKLLEYPPNVPKSVQLLRMENFAIPASYLVVGLLQGLSGPFLNVYALDLNATEAQQTTISSLRALPAALKLIFGFLSDTVPLFSYRRKSYMFCGWCMASLSMLVLLANSDLNGALVKNDGGGDGGTVGGHLQQQQPPSIPFFSLCVFLFGMGMWFADVMADALVAEKAKLEPESSHGQLQSTCYACRFFGLMVASPLSTVLYSTCGPGIIVWMMAFLPMGMLPLAYCLKELRVVVVGSSDHIAALSPSDGDVDVTSVKSVREQCREIWTTVCSRAVWQPMIFVYLYNLLQVGNAAWREYLKSVLGFTSSQLNALLVMAYVLLYLGVMTYKYYLITWSWRSIYVIVLLLNSFFSALQLLLIKGITFGMSPFVFAMGDDAFGDFLEGIQFLPITIMMVHLCPTGSEGASYAMFTTVSNSAINLSVSLSTLMLGIWDVSKETLISGDLSGMMKLTILTSVMQTSAIFFVKMMPCRKEDLRHLHHSSYSGSKLGGFIFVSIVFLSIFYSIVVSALNIVKPGWAGESR